MTTQKFHKVIKDINALLFVSLFIPSLGLIWSEHYGDVCVKIIFTQLLLILFGNVLQAGAEELLKNTEK